MPDEKQDASFKVIDRRLFTPEGELREEAVESRREADTQTGEGGSSAASALPGAPDASPAPAQSPQPAAEPPQALRSFQVLVDFIARNAALLLGAYPDPRTGQAILDLEGAQELVDMLDALREKTRGNLAPEEDQLLIEIIGSLKMQFLEMSKAAAKAMREKATLQS